MPNPAASSRLRLTDRLIEAGAVAVLRLPDAEQTLSVVEALAKGGITGIEVTMTVPDALGVLAAVERAFGADILLGVGTVLDAETAHRAIDAGARFVVSPVFKPSIIAAAHQQGVPAVPGAFTPTEAQAAHEAGADMVKIFPANVVGMPFFKAILAPLPHLRLMPTGGVTLENAGDWLRAGAQAVGVGSALLDQKALRAGDYDLLTTYARRLRENIHAARS